MDEQEVKHEVLQAGMRVLKYDDTLGWVPGTMRKVTHAGREALNFVADGGRYAPSPTWPDSRFMLIDSEA